MVRLAVLQPDLIPSQMAQHGKHRAHCHAPVPVRPAGEQHRRLISMLVHMGHRFTKKLHHQRPVGRQEADDDVQVAPNVHPVGTVVRITETPATQHLQHLAITLTRRQSSPFASRQDRDGVVLGTQRRGRSNISIK